MNTKNRVSWIDISKGIAIILVVLGHSIQSYGNDNDVLFKCIYSFHMPAFFVVSGLTFKWADDFKTYIKRKAKVLLLPYVGFVMITFFYNCCVALLKGNGIDTVTDRISERLTRTLLVTSDSYFINLWFLPCLFLSLLLAHIVFNKFDNLPELDERKEMIKKVTKEDIINVAKKIRLNTIYVLEGGK